MRSRSLAIAVITATLVLSGADAFAGRKIATVQGVLETPLKGKGTLKTGKDSGYYFDTASDAGKKILSTCQVGKICVVRGVITGHKIQSAYYVNVGK